MRIDLIIEGARIWTGDPKRPRANRIGVWGGQVFALDEELDGLSADLRFDAEGAFLAPGFNDVHAHSVWFGQTLLELDLSGIASADELLQRIADYADAQPESAWVIGSNTHRGTHIRSMGWGSQRSAFLTIRLSWSRGSDRNRRRWSRDGSGGKERHVGSSALSPAGLAE